MPFDAAKLSIQIDSSDLKKGDRELKKFGDTGAKTEGRVGKSTKGMVAGFNSMKVAVAGVAATFASLGVAIRVLSQYDQQMAKVGAVSRATAKDMKELRSVAASLGASTEFSAMQAGKGLEFLARAGFSAKESVSAIPAVLNLATAAAMDLGAAADTASNIMSAFGIEAAKAADVADVLAAASARANTDVSQLGGAMAMVGPVAAALDISMSDAAAAIGVLSDAGIQGTAAGTGLRRVLSTLANTTPAATKAIESMGLKVKDLNPQTHSLTQIIDTLSQSGMDAAKAMEIFGDRGGPAILALTSQAGNLRKLTDELKDVGGEAERMADQIRDNLGGDLDGLWSSLQGVIIALGDAGLTHVLRLAIQGVTALARAIGGIVNILGTITNGIGSFAGWLLTAKTNQELLEQAISNSNLEMDKSATKTAEVIDKLQEMKRVTIEVAETELEMMRAVRERLAAQEAANKEASGYGNALKEAQLDIRDALAEVLKVEEQIAIVRKTNPQIEDAGREQLEAANAVLKDTLASHQAIKEEMESRNYLSEEEQKLLDEHNTAIRIYERAIEKSRLGMVDLGNATAQAAAETERVIAATAQWEVTMIGVKGQLQAIGSLIAQLGGGAIAAVAKQTEISALRAGASIKDAAIAANEYKENLELSARKMELNAKFGKTVGGVMGTVLEKQVQYGREQDKTLDALRESALEAEKLSKKTGKAGGGAAKLSKEMKEAAKSAKELANEIQRLEFNADPLKKYNHELEELNKIMATGQLSDGAYAHAVQELTDGLANQIPMVNDVANAWGDFIAGGLKDFKGFVNSILKSFTSMLSQMIAMAARNKIMLSIGGGGSVAGTAASAAGGLGGGGGILGSIFGAGGSITGAGGLAGGASGLLGTSGVFGTIGANLAGTVGNMIGGVGSQLAASMAGIGATLGAAVPIIGGVVAAISFFKKSTKQLDEGLIITANNTDAFTKSFEKTQTKRFWGLSKKNSTKEGGEERDNPVTQAVDQIRDTTLEMGAVLGLTADHFASFNTSIKLSLKGLSEADRQAKIQEALEQIADEFSYAALGHFEELYGGIIREGEGAADTMQNMVIGLQLVNGAFDLLNFKMMEASVFGGAAARDIADLFGGFDAFAQKTATYYDLFYSDSEKLADAVGMMSFELGKLGIDVLPKTLEGFRALVEQAESMGDMESVAGLIGLSGAFANILAATEEVDIAIANAAQAMQSGMNSLVDSFYSTEEQLDYYSDLANAHFEAAGMAMPATAEAFKAAAMKAAADVQTIIGLVAQGQASLASLRAAQAAQQAIVDGAGLADKVYKAEQAIVDARLKAQEAAAQAASSAASARARQASDAQKKLQNIFDAIADGISRLMGMGELTSQLTLKAAENVILAARATGNVAEDAFKDAVAVFSDLTTDAFATRLDFDRERLARAGLIANVQDTMEAQQAHSKLPTFKRGFQYAQYGGSNRPPAFDSGFSGPRQDAGQNQRDDEELIGLLRQISKNTGKTINELLRLNAAENGGVTP